MTTPTIVSGAVSTVIELGKDEAWMKGWLKEQPTRLGLGELTVTDGASDDDDHSFVATDDDRCFSVDVQLGEMDASRGFGVLDNWARNRVLHPDKTHVAVLVTESSEGRYQTTLETLAEHLPLVVVELQVWRGDSEAIVVPYVALSSDDVDLSSTPAAKAAEAVAKAEAVADEPEANEEAEPVEAEAEVADEAEVEVPEDKNDTGVSDPWGAPYKEPEAVATESNGSTGDRLLSKIGN
ncbi:MAG: hypothetical protein U9O18_04200 [Chloroflexota bacterium]|nr:hypothetical protein [Chloroflexota bacterium]